MGQLPHKLPVSSSASHLPHASLCVTRPGSPCGDLGFAACFCLTTGSVNISDMQAFWRYLNPPQQSCGGWHSHPHLQRKNWRLGKVKITHQVHWTSENMDCQHLNSDLSSSNYNQTISRLAHAVNSHHASDQMSLLLESLMHGQHPIVLFWPFPLTSFYYSHITLFHHHLSIHLSSQEPMTN